MDYLSYFLKRFDLDLRPNNAEWIDVNHAADLLYPGAHIATSNPYEHYHHGIVVDLAKCNCESFARYCRTKEWKSEQVQRMLDLLEEKSMEIYEKIQNADESNRRNISTLVEALPSGALNPTERELYEQFCHRQQSPTG